MLRRLLPLLLVLAALPWVLGCPEKECKKLAAAVEAMCGLAPAGAACREAQAVYQASGCGPVEPTPPPPPTTCEPPCSPGERCVTSETLPVRHECVPTPPPPVDCREVLCPPGTHCKAGRCVPDPAPPTAGCELVSAGKDFDQVVGHVPEYGAAVNTVMQALTGCDVGSRCVITQGPKAWLAAVVAELRARGHCAGYDPAFDEIAVARAPADAPWEGFHVYAGRGWDDPGSPGTVVWSPAADRPAWLPRAGEPGEPPAPPTPPPAGGCGAPEPPPLARWNLKVHDRAETTITFDSTPLVRGREFCYSIGLTDPADPSRGREFCPPRAEGHPERAACEALVVGGLPAWTWSLGATCRHPQGNPYSLRCRGIEGGRVQVCSQDLDARPGLEHLVCGELEVAP